MSIDMRRVRSVNNKNIHAGQVVYWMSRDQRVQDNWALLYARQLARERQQSCAVVFCLNPVFLSATIRQYGFMIKGLQQVEQDLEKLGIPFFLLLGSPEDTVPVFVSKHAVGAIVSDFDPLRIKMEWKKTVGQKVGCALVEVDAHNVVPCWHASSKLEFGAYTIRPKIKKLLPEFLTEFPHLQKQVVAWSGALSKVDWRKALRSLQVNTSVPEVTWLQSGEKNGRRELKKFITNSLDVYDEKRNDPNAGGQSGLSPYIHFGQISAQRVALEVKTATDIKMKNKETFLEELIVRRELADNFCLYNTNYDAFLGFPRWAQESLNKHRKDEREHSYTYEQFDRAQTHDELWNAAQKEMVQTGKMHGYLRMYWAKKILEWTSSPEDALAIAIRLNDTYELDGRDPNGYAGIAWSIGGVHDRAWFERPVFGKIRFMNFNGCKSKFDVKKYVATHGV